MHNYSLVYIAILFWGKELKIPIILYYEPVLLLITYSSVEAVVNGSKLNLKVFLICKHIT